MSRWKASAIHACISLLLLSIIVVGMALTWYPPLLAWASGKTGIASILIGVDACLGPLLTLVIFKAGKPGLKFDLAVISLFQIAALCYGLYVLYEARPVYIVFAVDRFELVSAVDIPEAGLLDKTVQERFQTLPLAGPEIIGAVLPKDDRERLQLGVGAVRGGADIHQLPRYYRPYAEIAKDAINRASPLDKLLRRDDATRDELTQWLEKNQKKADLVKYLRLMTKLHELTVLIDGGTGDVLDILSVKP